MNADSTRKKLLSGCVIPAHPLALDHRRQLDEQRQRALTRYYVEAGAGAIAVGVHTTQFAIRDHGLYEPVLNLAAETAREWSPDKKSLLIAGVIGATAQAVREAEVASSLGYEAGLLSLAALSNATDEELVGHCRAVADVIPLFGFYLQPAVGGRPLGYGFWRRFAEIENVVGVKVAPFDRAETETTVRAICDSGRFDVGLYTGNDDNIVGDLTTPFQVTRDGEPYLRYFDGGLLGQWAVWTHRAVSLFDRCRAARAGRTDDDLPAVAKALTATNAAIFDAANGYAGCIPGIHEILRRQGFLRAAWCLDPTEALSPGQLHLIDAAYGAFPFLRDDEFVAERIERWMMA